DDRSAAYGSAALGPNRADMRACLHLDLTVLADDCAPFAVDTDNLRATAHPHVVGADQRHLIRTDTRRELHRERARLPDVARRSANQRVALSTGPLCVVALRTGERQKRTRNETKTPKPTFPQNHSPPPRCCQVKL